ncbi:MAG: hypothetical protein WBH09_04940 [Rugosibacter sp.]
MVQPMVQPVVKHYASRQIANGFNAGAVSPAPTFLLTAQTNSHHRETTGAQHGLQRPTDGRIFGDSAWTCSLPASSCCTLVHGLVQEIAANIDDAVMKLLDFGLGRLPVVVFFGGGLGCDAMLKRQHQALSGFQKAHPVQKK